MDPVTLILLVLLVLVLLATFSGGDAYRGPGLSVGGLLLIILVVYLLTST